VSPPTLTPILVAAILVWRGLVTVRDAREASRRWSVRAALPWAGLLLGVDLVTVAGAVWVPAPPDGTVLALLVALAVAAALRNVPVRRGGRSTSLRRFVLARIEQAAYDRADDWIYRLVYPGVTGRRMKPLLNAIRQELERQPGPRGSLDGSYVAGLIHAGRTPSREDLRAACHRMLVRHGRRRLADLVATASARTERVPPGTVPGPAPPAPGPARAPSNTISLAIYIEADDHDSANRVLQAAEAVARVVGDTERV
jgi:hypothetical protein